MKKRNCTHVQALLPEIKAITQREVAERYGLKDKYVVKQPLIRERRMWLWLKSQNILRNPKTECIYRRKPATFSEANELVDRYIDFYNRERIQLKTGDAPLTRRLST